MPKYVINLNTSGPILTKTGIVDRAIRGVSFTSDQMASIGEYDVGIMKDRIGDLRDIYDEPVRALTPKYARRKASKGLPAERDLTYSGIMLRALQVLESDQTHVKVGLKGSIPFRKALFNQNIDPWFGLSDRDESRLMEEKVRPLFQENIAKIIG